MPKLVGGILALSALATGIVSQVEPVQCVLRAFLAYVVGVFCGHVWYMIIKPVRWSAPVRPAMADAERRSAERAEPSR